MVVSNLDSGLGQRPRGPKGISVALLATSVGGGPQRAALCAMLGRKRDKSLFPWLPRRSNSWRGPVHGSGGIVAFDG